MIGWGKITKYSFLKKSFVLYFIVLFFSSFFIYAQTNATADSSQVSVENASNFSSPKITLDTDESEIALDFASDSSESQNRTNQASSGFGFWAVFRMLLVLALVIAVIYFIFKFLKKGIEPKVVDDDPFLRKVSSVTLSPGKSVQIVTLLDKAFILGVSDDSVNVIDKVDDVELINAMNLYADKNSVSKPKSFNEILELFMPQKNSEQKSENKPKEKKSLFTKKKIVDEETKALLDSLKKQRLNTEE